MSALARAAIVVYALDWVILAFWGLSGFAMWGLGCWDLLFVHVVVGVHLGVQTVSLAFVIDENREGSSAIDTESGGANHGQPRPLPLGWITASIIVLFGDIFLLARDSHNYVVRDTLLLTDDCVRMLIVEIFIEACMTTTATLSILWYITLAITRAVHRRETPTRPKNK